MTEEKMERTSLIFLILFAGLIGSLMANAYVLITWDHLPTGGAAKCIAHIGAMEALKSVNITDPTASPYYGACMEVA